MYNYLLKHKILFAFSMLLIILCSISQIIKAFIFGKIFDTITLNELEVFKSLVIFTAAFLILKFILSYLQDYTYGILTKKSLISIKKDYFEGILNQSLEDFSKIDSSKHLSTLTNDLNILNNDFFNSFKEIISSLSCFIFSIIVMLKVNIWYVIISVSLSTIPFFLSKCFTKNQIKLKTMYSSELSSFVSKTKEFLGGFEVIKNYGMEKKIKKLFNVQNEKLENSFLQNNKFQYIIDNMTGFVLSSTFFTTLLFGGYLVLTGKITLGAMMTVTQVMNYIIDPLDLFTVCSNKMRSLKTIWNNMTKIINTNYEAQNNELFNEIKESIKINNLSFSYVNSKPILKNINIVFEKGKKYAIIGKSGCGKSTLIKLISKYYNSYEGEIFIDNVPLKSIPYSQWRMNFAIITQNIFMFNDTIQNNITLYDTFDESTLNYSINISGLSDTISTLKNNINTNIVDNGINISGGQKQRISLARAMIRTPSLLILDEITSSLDTKTSYDIENNILGLDGVTVISVTHKLNVNLLRKYDKIILMDRGTIEDVGSFDELLTNSNSFNELLSC